MKISELLNESQGVAEGSIEELANTSLDVKEPKNFVNVNDRKQTTWKIFKFKSGKNTFLVNFTVQKPPTYGKKQNWNAVNVAFGVKEPQDDYSFGDEMNTDLTGRNKNQFLIYSTVINTIRRFITEYNTEIDEIIMQGAGERQEAMYQRFFQSAGKYFPGWHYNGKHSLVRDVPRQTEKKVREQGVAEDWNKVNHHDHTNGLSQKAVNSYRHEHPGSHLQTAVTTKPSKLKKGSKDAKRRKSFCARMSGNKGPMKKPNGKPTPKALALRRWHCESLFELFVTAKKGIYEAEGEPSGLKHLTPHLAQDILDQMKKEGVHAIVKSIEWGDGGAKELIAMIKRDLEQIANNASESITTNDIHALADSKGVKWDNEPNFLKLTKRLTGKEHLDDLDQSGLHKVKQHLESMNAKMQENFADGKHPEDQGDSKRYGVPTKASVSTLRKVAHQGGRKGQLAHWMANMKAGKAKHAGK